MNSVEYRNRWCHLYKHPIQRRNGERLRILGDSKNIIVVHPHPRDDYNVYQVFSNLRQFRPSRYFLREVGLHRLREEHLFAHLRSLDRSGDIFRYSDDMDMEFEGNRIRKEYERLGFTFIAAIPEMFIRHDANESPRFETRIDTWTGTKEDVIAWDREDWYIINEPALSVIHGLEENLGFEYIREPLPYERIDRNRNIVRTPHPFIAQTITGQFIASQRCRHCGAKTGYCEWFDDFYEAVAHAGSPASCDSCSGNLFRLKVVRGFNGSTDEEDLQARREVEDWVKYWEDGVTDPLAYFLDNERDFFENRAEQFADCCDEYTYCACPLM